MSCYQCGDIGAIPNQSLLGKFTRRVFYPHTDLFHFFLICRGISGQDDYIILESIGKGISVGRLSWYKHNKLRVFRPQITFNSKEHKELGTKACQALIDHGRARYDYLLCIKLLFGCIYAWGRQLIKEHRVRAIRPIELPYARDSRLICTEAANEAWRAVGFPIIPKGVVPLPAGFIDALNCGKLKEVTSWTAFRTWKSETITGEKLNSMGV